MRAARLALGPATALALFLVYVSTGSRTVAIGDAGELITAAATLGIAHPPGYPLWCLVMSLLAKLPGLSPAHWVNLGSAISAAAAGYVFYRIASGPLGMWTPLAAAITLVHGFGFAIWSQAVMAEVYAFSLLILLVTCGLHLADPAGQGRAGRFVPYGVGLSLVAHAGSWPVLLALVVDRMRRGPLVGARTGWLFMGVFIGLTPLLYLPIRSSAGPPLDWGHPADLAGFLAHVGREQYGGFHWPAWTVWADLLHRWWTLLLELTLILGLIAAVAAVVHGWRRWSVRMLGLWVVLAGPVSITLMAGLLREEQLVEPEVFWLPSFAFLLLLAGVGSMSLPRRLRAASTLAALLLALSLLIFGARDVDESRNTIAYDYGVALLEGLEPEAVLYVLADHEAFPAMYLQAVEGRRPDVSLRPLGAPTPRDVYGHRAPRVETVVTSGRPVYVTLPRPPFESMPLVPDGLRFRVGDGAPRWVPVTLGHDGSRGVRHFGEVALASVHMHEAAFAFAIDDPDSARACLRRARVHASRNPRQLTDLGTLAARNEAFDDARLIWRETRERFPDHDAAWISGVRLEILVGDTLAARRLLDEARRVGLDVSAMARLERTLDR